MLLYVISIMSPWVRTEKERRACSSLHNQNAHPVSPEDNERKGKGEGSGREGEWRRRREGRRAKVGGGEGEREGIKDAHSLRIRDLKEHHALRLELHELALGELCACEADDASFCYAEGFEHLSEQGRAC